MDSIKFRGFYSSTEEQNPEQQPGISENISLSFSLKEQQKMSDYSGLAKNHSQMIAEDSEIQTKPEHSHEVLQEDIEMSSGSSGNDFSGNDTNENYSSGHDSHGHESDENGKDSAMLMETSDCHKSSSSNAFSLMIANSEHNQSSSGCRIQASSLRINQHQLQETLCMNSASDPDSLEKPGGTEGSNLDTSECPTVLVGFSLSQLLIRRPKPDPEQIRDI